MKSRFPFPFVQVTPLSQVLLQTSTKEDLFDLCDDYRIPYRKNLNKAALSENIEIVLLRTPELLFECLPFSESQALQKIVRAGGYLKTKEPLETFHLERQQLVQSPVDEGRLDILRPDSVFEYAIPANLQKTLAPIIDKLMKEPRYKILGKREQILLGLFRIYGALSESDLRKIWEKTTHEELEQYDLLYLLTKRIQLKQEFIPFYYDNKLCIASEIVDYPLSFYKEIQKRKDLDYAIYPIEYILGVAESTLGSISYRSLKGLISFLDKKNNGNTIISTLQVTMIWESIQMGNSITEIVSQLTDEVTFESKEDLNRFMNVLIDFTNEIPQWLIKGHSPSKLHDSRPLSGWGPMSQPASESPKPSVGRNDLCPCGSGKKYKKCCGAN